MLTFLFERSDTRFLLFGKRYFIQAVQQAVLAESIDLKLSDCASRYADSLGCKVDGDAIEG